MILQFRQYYVVCAFQVLEYFSNSLKFIIDMISLLNPGGKIILCIPNT
jgi:hypothetical protein